MPYIGKEPAKVPVTAADIPDNSITAAKIVDGVITAADIATGAVDTAELAADAVDGTKIADNAIDSEHIAADSIDAEHYAAGSVDTTALGADAVTGAKIADDAVESEHIAAGAVDNAHLATGIASSKLTGALPAIDGSSLTGLSSFDPDGAVTINESGADVDFRVESDNDANALFVQGSDGNVGIGISTPTNPLTVEGDGARIAFSNTATYPCLGGISAFRSGTSHGNMYIETAGGSNFNTPVERMAIEGTTGEVKISTGDLIFGTAGKGIVLGNTSNVDANTLDDYEEGTWSPTASSSGWDSLTFTDTGSYTKIGNIVHVMVKVSVDGSGTGSGDTIMGGLPFTSSSTGDYRSAISIFACRLASDIDTYVSGYIDSNSTTVVIREGGTTGDGNDLASHFDSGSYFYFQATYRV
jgi:hypothetical protein